MSVPFPLPDIVLYHSRAGHPRELFRQIVQELHLAKGIQPDMLTDMLVLTEAAGGSAIGDGVAVVSCRAPLTVTAERVCAFARLARPIAFKGVESHPCDLVFVIVSPEDEAQAHLRDLSTIIRTLRDRDFTARLRAESAPERLMGIFKARDVAVRAAA